MKQGWDYGTLEDAVKKGSSNISLNKIKDDEGNYPVFSAKGFAKNVSFFQQKQEYIAIIKDGAGIGRVAKYPAKSSVVATMQYLIPKEGFDIGFIEYFLNGIDFEKHRSGSTIPHVYFKDYKSEPFPLIPLPEQQRIVEILDKAFVAIDKAKQNAEQNLRNAKEVFENYLQGVFENKGEGWEEKTLGMVANHSLGKMLDKNKNKGTLKKYLRNQSVRWFEFDLHGLTEMLFLEDEKEKYTAIKGDVLICEGGYPGRAAIWQEDYPIYFQKAIHRVRFHEAVYNKWFLYYLFVSDRLGQLKKYFTGTGIQHFTGASLDKFILPIPSKNEVKTLVYLFEKLSKKIKKLKAIYQQKLDNLDELKKSILQKAFRGEL